MSVLLTGGTGFVGLNIAEALLDRGLEVVVLDRSPPPAAAMLRLSAVGPAFHVAQGDVGDAALLDRLFEEHGVDLVVQAAAITAGIERERRDAGEIVRVNLGGTVAVLQAAQRHGVRRLVYMSSSSVYGENGYGDDPLDEAATAPMPDALYAITKYAGERAALRFRTLHDMDIVATRLSGVFGPWERDTGVRDTLSPLLQASEAARRGEEVVLERDGVRDWVYVRDVASAVATLLTLPSQPAHTVYNVGPGVTWSVADWCRLLAARDPGFRWRIGTPASIDLHGPRDRNRLAIARLTADTDWRPAYGLDAAFTHYMKFLDELEAT